MASSIWLASPATGRSFGCRSPRVRHSSRRRGSRVDPPSGLAVGNARLFFADLDNNGGADAVISTRPHHGCCWRVPAAVSRAAGATLPGGIGSAADLDGDGVLELVARGRWGAGRAGQGTKALSLAGDPAAGGDGDRRSAHQLMRNRR